MFSRSYINRFSNSWHFYARANDIAKREKLKKALSDALFSMENKHRSKLVTSVDNNAAVRSNIDKDTVSRIRHAATLLKQFKKMYSLSEGVKKTLQNYNEAKHNLTQLSDESNAGLQLLKRFLVVHRKEQRRDNIPSGKSSTLIDKVVEDTDDNTELELEFRNAKYLKRTNRISLKVTPLGRHGQIGMEFTSVDPHTSSVARANRAFQAASVLLKYMAIDAKSPERNISVDGKLFKRVNTSYISPIEQTNEPVVPTLRRQYIPSISAMRLRENLGKSLVSSVHQDDIVKSDNAHIMESLVDGDADKLNGVSARKKEIVGNKKYNRYISLLKKYASQRNDSKTDINPSTSSNKTIDVASNDEMKSKKDFTGYSDRNDTHSSSNKTDKTDKIEIYNSSNKTENQKIASIHNITERDNITQNISKTDDISENTSPSQTTSNETDHKQNSEANETEINWLEDKLALRKQQETLRQLKEAKLAREKYEVAKKELAEKVKQLYVMANEYEKEETKDQVLEVKNFISAVKGENNVEDHSAGPNVKRDEENHPGVALSGIHNHKVGMISTNNVNDHLHKGFTMGSNDKNEHQVELKDSKQPEIKKVYDIGSSVSSNLRLDDLAKTVVTNRNDIGKDSTNAKSQEESLKIIAEAIKQDMDEISNNESKKKLLTSAMSTEQKSLTDTAARKNTDKIVDESPDKEKLKKGGPPSDMIGQYLTEALAAIMGNGSTHVNEKEEDKNPDDDRNKKIVEKAMKNHAKNPDLPLPLLKTKGEKIVLNKPTASKSSEKTGESKNDVFAHATDQDKPQTGLDYTNPMNRILLDKASHMEEQVAAAQDKLYNSDNSPAPAPSPLQTVTYVPQVRQAGHTNKQPSSTGLISSDPYGSIQERAEAAQVPSPMVPGGPMVPPVQEEDDDEEGNFSGVHFRQTPLSRTD